MSLLLGTVLISWFITSLLFLPFIRMLYKFKFQRMKQETKDVFDNRTPIFDKFHQNKAGTPVGGGILIIAVVILLLPIILLLMHYFWVPITSVYSLLDELKIILFTFIGFGLLGLLDDAKKTFVWESKDFIGLRLRHKLFLEIVLALIVSVWLYFDLKIDIFYLPIIGIVKMGWLYIPFSCLVIVGFSNALNITDGLDGLASGLLMIAIFAFWTISASILDTPLSVFLALWLGAILAFLYFNIHPARIFLGDVGALSFGATLAVVALILGKAPVLLVIGSLFILEALSSFVQLVSKRFFKKKIFKVAPLHLWLQYYGWNESKIVMRFWILAIILAVFGLWIAFLSIPA